MPAFEYQQHGIRAAGPLQAALGELAYKSETAERLRMDLRAQVAKTREAEGRSDSARLEIEASNGAQLALRNELEAARQQLERQRRLEERLSVCQPPCNDLYTICSCIGRLSAIYAGSP